MTDLLERPPATPICNRHGIEGRVDTLVDRLVDSLVDRTADNLADRMVVQPVGRVVGVLNGHCPVCSGEYGWRPHPEIPDRWEFDRDYVGDCPHPLQYQGFLRAGRRVSAAYTTKDALLWALYSFGSGVGAVRAELQVTSGLATGQLDGALRRSLRSGHIARSLQREPLPIHGTAHRYKLSIRGLSYILLRFGANRDAGINQESKEAANGYETDIRALHIPM